MSEAVDAKAHKQQVRSVELRISYLRQRLAETKELRESLKAELDERRLELEILKTR